MPPNLHQELPPPRASPRASSLTGLKEDQWKRGALAWPWGPGEEHPILGSAFGVSLGARNGPTLGGEGGCTGHATPRAGNSPRGGDLTPCCALWGEGQEASYKEPDPIPTPLQAAAPHYFRTHDGGGAPPNWCKRGGGARRQQERAPREPRLGCKALTWLLPAASTPLPPRQAGSAPVPPWLAGLLASAAPSRRGPEGEELPSERARSERGRSEQADAAPGLPGWQRPPAQRLLAAKSGGAAGRTEDGEASKQQLGEGATSFCSSVADLLEGRAGELNKSLPA